VPRDADKLELAGTRQVVADDFVDRGFGLAAGDLERHQSNRDFLVCAADHGDFHDRMRQRGEAGKQQEATEKDQRGGQATGV
jgi:hypothetical protein